MKYVSGVFNKIILHALEAQMRDVNVQGDIVKVNQVQEIIFTARIQIVEHVAVFFQKFLQYGL
jgi:hypothetical protein